jgi:hypothetical protein
MQLQNIWYRQYSCGQQLFKTAWVFKTKGHNDSGDAEVVVLRRENSRVRFGYAVPAGHRLVVLDYGNWFLFTCGEVK